MDHLLQGMNMRLLEAQDCYVAQYIIRKQLVHLTPQRIVQRYEVFQDDMSGDLRQLQNKVGRWKARWETMNVAGILDTLNNTIQEINPDLYPKMYTAVILMVMSVSTATAERCVSAMKRPKKLSPTTTERMSGLTLMHVHKNTDLAAERIIHQNNRRILFRHERRQG